MDLLSQATGAGDALKGVLDAMNREAMSGPFGDKQGRIGILAFAQIAVDPNPGFRTEIDFPFFMAFAQHNDRLAIAV